MLGDSRNANEVWSFAKVEQEVTAANNLQEATGVYYNPKANGPPTFHVEVKADGELKLFYPEKPHRKCLVIAANEKVVDFAAWTEDGRKYKLFFVESNRTSMSRSPA